MRRGYYLAERCLVEQIRSDWGGGGCGRIIRVDRGGGGGEWVLAALQFVMRLC